MKPAPRNDIYRSYRGKVSGLTNYRLAIGETDLWVSSSWNSKEPLKVEIRRLRIQLKEYIKRHPDFLTALKPWQPPEDLSGLPEIVRRMVSAARATGVGPMAAVAGAIAGLAGEKLYRSHETLIIENGGDIYLSSPDERLIGIYAGDSCLSSRMALKIMPEMAPLGICTSAAKVGPSLSFGQADAVVVLSSNTALADATATALGNRIKKQTDLTPAVRWSQTIPGVLGALVIMGDKMAAWGQIELVPITSVSNYTN